MLRGHREQQKHRDAFEAWYSIGCNYHKSSQKLGVPEPTLRNWGDWYAWREIADRRDMAAARKVEAAAIDRRAKLIEEQRKAGQLLRSLGVQHFVKNKEKPFESSKSALAAIKDGFALERQAEGLPDWVGTILNASDDDLLEQFYRLQRETETVVRGAGGTETTGD